jgi:hypothetical protein
MRNPVRHGLVAAFATTLLLAACGAPTAPVARATQTPTGSAPAATSPAPTAVPTPTPKPAPPALVALTEVSATNVMTIRLVGLDGTTVASTTMPGSSVNGWPKAGPDGAYWLDASGTFRRLGRDGTVTAITTMPLGSFYAIGPGGEVAYETSSVQSPAGGTPASPDNRLYLVSSGTAHLLAERSSKGTEDGGANAPGIPPNDWYYDPVGWTDAGVFIARLPEGGCGCGPFGMDTVQGYTGVVDPVTGLAGSVTGDPTCPVSGIAADGTGACFHTPVIPASKNEGRGADALRILRDGKVVQSFDLSTRNAGGDAIFNADSSVLAYATVAAGSECGSWQTLSQLRVLDLASGTAKSVGPAGLQPLAWLADGRLVATSWTSTGSSTPPLTRAVIVDPATGTVQPLPSTQSTGTQLLGLVTA